jgi:uncharacterized membrane protein HdeD (DUF308 family)
MFVVSGLVKLAAGVAIIFWPIDEFTPLIYLFGIPAIVQGIIHINAAIHNRRMFDYWWVLLLVGIGYMAAGLFVLGFRGITPVFLITVIAVTWLFAGVVMILISIQMNREWEEEFELLLAGILSLMLGIYVVTHLHQSVYSILWVVISYSFLIGLLTIMFGLKARSWQHMYFDDIME